MEDSSQSNKTRLEKIKSIQIIKKELPLFSDDIIIYAEISMKSTKMLLKPISEFNKFA